MALLLDSGVHNYRITRGLDLSLQFNPPIGSLELANALSYRYPMVQDLESKMRRAILDHLNTENQHPEMRPGATSIDPTSSISAGNRTSLMDSNSNTSWNIVTGNPLKRKRKKSAYSDTKRKKVAGVRKRGACPSCRRRKVEVEVTPTSLSLFFWLTLKVYSLLSQRHGKSPRI